MGWIRLLGASDPPAGVVVGRKEECGDDDDGDVREQRRGVAREW